MGPRRFRIPVNKSQWLAVTVYPSHEEYQGGVAGYFGKKENRGFACYVTSGARKKRSGVWGKMFFSEDCMGAGVVAHEVQHFLFDWMVHKIEEVDWKHDEPLATLAGKVNAGFWDKYYA